MLYSYLKFFHVLSASLLIGGQIFLMLIFPKIYHIRNQIDLKIPRYLLLSSLLLLIATGIVLVDIAGMDYTDFWIKNALMLLGIYIVLIGISHKFITNKWLWITSWLVLNAILGLMIVKPEF